MSEDKGQVEMDEWTKKISEGLKDVEPAADSPESRPAPLRTMTTEQADKDLARKVAEEEEDFAKMDAEKAKSPPALLPFNKAPSITKPIVQNENSFLMDTAKFEHMQRVATLFSKSKLLPQIYQNDQPSCFIALHMAARMDIDPFTFMQNSYIVNGKPALEGKLMIAVLNSRGGYIDGIEYEYSGEGDDYGCRAFGTLRNGKVHEARVDIKLAKAEGWYAKNPKWKNMPDQMLAYRSAAFLLRKYRPELIMGLQTYEEVQDVDGVIVQSPVGGGYRRSELNDRLES